MPGPCPICLDPVASVESLPGGVDKLDVDCKACGKFIISATAAGGDVSRFGERYLLSALIRNKSEEGVTLDLGERSLENLKNSVRIPVDPFDKIDLLLQHIMRRSKRLDLSTRFSDYWDHPLIFAQDPAEFSFYVSKAGELGYIQSTPDGCGLTLDGWKRLQALGSTRRVSDQAFIAMWFDPGLDPAWENGFNPALRDCGYTPVRIDVQEHNEKICDRILAEIRRSALVVADFTGQRGGVYFESGFAMGLNLPVIRTCRRDDVEHLHFDTRQYSHVVWDTPEDLRSKLTNRIRATVPIHR